ncbi:MAG: hypothetical protein AB7I68_03945 [Porticoccaceae bacterium]
MALPDGEPPDRFDWSIVRGQFVRCTPPPDEIADHETLHELGMEMAAAGVAGLVLFDGERVLSEWWADAIERPPQHSARGVP